MNHHSLVNYIPAVFPVKTIGWDVERQNTAMRGQIILGSELGADLNSVNRLIKAFPAEKESTLEEKKQGIRNYVEKSICVKTFGISYVGRMDWGGLDKYVKDIHLYIG